MKKLSQTLKLMTVAIVTAVTMPTLCHAQSLWRDDTARPMCADKRAANIGDILTVLVQENSSATKKNNTSTAKEAGMDASISTFFYNPILASSGKMPALKYGSKNSFTGGGTIDNSQALVASVAVRVIDVLPNHNLVIEGKRETSFSGEQQTAVLHGIVRLEDIMANNTLYSYNIADAQVQIQSKGSLTDSQRKGWFTKVWDKVSPF
jgi:flagellar L-ring protein precursor FlgH